MDTLTPEQNLPPIEQQPIQTVAPTPETVSTVSKTKLGLVLITLLILLGAGFIGFRQYQQNQNPMVGKTATRINETPIPSPSPKGLVVPTPSPKPLTSPETLQNWVKNKEMATYSSKECGLSLTYPKATQMENNYYEWHIAAESKRPTIRYLGRTPASDPNAMDDGILVFATPSDDPESMRYDASVEVACALNDQMLSLTEFKDMYLKNEIQGIQSEEVKKTELKSITIDSLTFIPITLDSHLGTMTVFLGIHKDKLLEIASSNPGTGSLKTQAQNIIKTIKFQ